MALKNSIMYEHSFFCSQRNDDPVIIMLVEETLRMQHENDQLLKLLYLFLKLSYLLMLVENIFYKVKKYDGMPLKFVLDKK